MSPLAKDLSPALKPALQSHRKSKTPIRPTQVMIWRSWMGLDKVGDRAAQRGPPPDGVSELYRVGGQGLGFRVQGLGLRV